MLTKPVYLSSTGVMESLLTVTGETMNKNAVGITDQYFSTCLSNTCMMVGPVFVVLIIHRQLPDDRNRLDL